ncbi:hypothetical protein LTR28_001933 [Elasticomyces elasticus]|nr:hypothetical protein LTR28_001933 [Elasticomyces elasticus]
MARRSLRQPKPSPKDGQSNAPMQKQRKRAATTVTGLEQPKRTRSKNQLLTDDKAPKKSQYFAREASEDQNFDASSAERSDDASDGEESAYEDHGAVAVSLSEAEDDELDYSSDEDDKTKKRAAPRKGAAMSATIRTKGKELWRPGVKTGLGPGTQVIIEKPKARAAGRIPYLEHTIHPNTILFLKDLKVNNDREWLKSQYGAHKSLVHDPDYRASLADFNSFVEQLTHRLIEIDATIPELPVKDIVFRIYRDVRFSKDPTPYKVRRPLDQRN